MTASPLVQQALLGLVVLALMVVSGLQKRRLELRRDVPSRPRARRRHRR